MNKPMVLAITAMTFALLSCGPTAAPPAEPTLAGPSIAQPTAPGDAQPSPPPASSSVSDVSGIVACDLVSAQEVADLTGGSIFRELEQEPSPACIYEVATGPDGYAQFIVSIQPPDIAESAIAAIPEELGQAVAGMGDAAYLDYDEGADTYTLLVLVRGRFGMNVSGEGEDWTLAVGQLFLSRLLGP